MAPVLPLRVAVHDASTASQSPRRVPVIDSALLPLAGAAGAASAVFGAAAAAGGPGGSGRMVCLRTAVQFWPRSLLATIEPRSPLTQISSVPLPHTAVSCSSVSPSGRMVVNERPWSSVCKSWPLLPAK